MRKFSIGKTIMTIPFLESFGLQPTMLPYEQLKKDFEDAVRNKDILESPKIKIIQGQTGLGKSRYQDKEMPTILKEIFPELKYIIRISPTTEVANDGTFLYVDELDDENTQYFYCENPSPVSIKQMGRIPNAVICISTTHGYFSQNFVRLKELASESIVIIEEAHQYVGCGDEGGKAYVTTYGYHSEYGAKTVQKFFEWAEINPRIIGFTATVTRHHEGDVNLTDSFLICNKMQPKENLIGSQAWLDRTISYQFAKNQGHNSIAKSIHDSIETIDNKERALRELKAHDPNINAKLTGLYLAGTKSKVWGADIDDTREVIAEYLLGLDYEPTDKMIATMTETGIRVWNLKGESETIPKNNSGELIRRLDDPTNPLRFVVVINRARSGINVHNFAVEVVCRLRDPKEIRTLIPIQMFGRLVRINVGTGNIIRNEYKNNIREYILGYSEKYGIPIDIVVETIKVANTFDIWYPSNDKVQRTWEDSIVDFKKDYVNMKDIGYEYLDQFIDVEKPPLVDFLPLTILRECNGEMVEYDISEEVSNWKGDGTLDAFFKIGV